MKARIIDSIRSRHPKEDKGFTLIELLVVILIIAILAAVGIAAFLASLNSGKKSAAKTTMTNAVKVVRATQTASGAEDFSSMTMADAEEAEPNLTWIVGSLGPDEVTNYVGVFGNGTNISSLNTRDSSGHCFYTMIDLNAGTGYASSKVGTDEDCDDHPTFTAPETTDEYLPLTWFRSQKVGWSVED